MIYVEGNYDSLFSLIKECGVVLEAQEELNLINDLTHQNLVETSRWGQMIWPTIFLKECGFSSDVKNIKEEPKF